MHSQTVEKPQGERERAEALSHFNRTRRRVRRGRAIFPAENLIFQRKNRFPAVSAPGNPLGFQRRLEGVVVAGERLPGAFYNISSSRDFSFFISFLTLYYMVMNTNFRQKSTPITATIMSFFSNYPVKRVIRVYAIEPIPIPLAMEYDSGIIIRVRNAGAADLISDMSTFLKFPSIRTPT